MRDGAKGMTKAIWAEFHEHPEDVSQMAQEIRHATLNKVIINLHKLDENNFESELKNIILKWHPYHALVCNAMWFYHDNIQRSA